MPAMLTSGVSRRIAWLRAEFDRLQKRLDAMYVDKLDGRVDAALFDKLSAEPDVRIFRIRLSDWLHREAHETNHWPQA